MATLESLEGMIIDLTEAVQTGFARVDDRFERLETRVDIVEVGLGRLATKVDEMSETLDAVAEAVSKDAVTLIDHDRRIVRLEK